MVSSALSLNGGSSSLWLWAGVGGVEAGVAAAPTLSLLCVLVWLTTQANCWAQFVSASRLHLLHAVCGDPESENFRAETSGS